MVLTKTVQDMKMTTSDIRQIVKDARMAGFDIRVKDIMYAIVRKHVDDAQTVYRGIYDVSPGEEAVKAHESQLSFKYLSDALSVYVGDPDTPANSRLGKPGSKYKDISFEENKEALIELLDEIQSLKGTDDLSVRDAVKLETEIRTRLNDKFAVSDKKEEHRIVVQPKFNTICPTTRKECFLQTKEFAMEHWGLVEKDKHKA